MRDLWFKNAVIYCLDVESFGRERRRHRRFRGADQRLAYLAGLGVTCVWLRPSTPRPDRDNGYDIADYYGVDPRLGTLGEYVEFIAPGEQLGLRVIVDLVVNHTSDSTPGSSRPAKDPDSPYRDWYVWSEGTARNAATASSSPASRRRPGASTGSRRSGTSTASTTSSPTSTSSTRRSARRSSGSWASGSSSACSGFRVDAVPFLVE